MDSIPRLAFSKSQQVTMRRLGIIHIPSIIPVDIQTVRIACCVICIVITILRDVDRGISLHCFCLTVYCTDHVLLASKCRCQGIQRTGSARRRIRPRLNCILIHHEPEWQTIIVAVQIISVLASNVSLKHIRFHRIVGEHVAHRKYCGGKRCRPIVTIEILAALHI